jgi:hypothetical protein
MVVTYRPVLGEITPVHGVHNMGLSEEQAALHVRGYSYLWSLDTT